MRKVRWNDGLGQTVFLQTSCRPDRANRVDCTEQYENWGCKAQYNERNKKDWYGKPCYNRPSKINQQLVAGSHEIQVTNNKYQHADNTNPHFVRIGKAEK